METPATRPSVSEEIPPVKKQQFWKTGASGAYLPDGAFPPGVQELVTFTVPPEPIPRESPAAPERALWRAVFEDAIRVFADRIYLADDQDRVDAERWIMSEEIYVGSFDFVCHVLGKDPRYVRGRLVSLKRKVAAKSVVGEYASADPKPIAKGGGYYGNSKRKSSKKWTPNQRRASEKMRRSRVPLNVYPNGEESPPSFLRVAEDK